MSKPARKLYKDFSLVRDGRLGCPTSFNRLTVAWYLKQAAPGIKPNVRPDRYYEFRGLRDIAPGEELAAEFSPKRETVGSAVLHRTRNDTLAESHLLARQGVSEPLVPDPFK
jgi:hypothetical protein